MPLLEQLRGKTTEYHERLHVHPALHMLTDGTLTRAYLTNALKKFYGFYLPLEHRYASSQILLQDLFPPHTVIPRLENDLAKAGINPAGLPIIDQPNNPFNIEEAIGYLYLREGSNLGGKVISKNLTDTLHLSPGIDNQFFWGHGADTGKNWKRFIEKLGELEPHINVNAAAEYAAYLFKVMDQWFHDQEEKYA